MATFEDLPQVVRFRIYSYALDLAWDLTNNDNLGVFIGVNANNLVVKYHAQAAAPIDDLSLVSRLVADDMLPWFCSGYQVGLDCTAIASVESEKSPLLQILPHCRRLCICLDKPCIQHYAEVNAEEAAEDDTEDDAEDDAEHDEEEDAGDDALHVCLPRPSPALWQRFCQSLSSTPSLILHLEGRFNHKAYAEAVVEGLKDLDLSEVGIADIGKSLPRIVKVLEEPARSLTQDEIAKRGPFRLLDLPTELRLRILSFTDLVAPFLNIVWTNGNSPRYSPPFSRANSRACEEGFCRRKYHGNVHRTTYPPCSCWQPPRSLFLVCQQMTEDARQVFYSSNRFDLSRPSREEEESEEYDSERDPSEFEDDNQESDPESSDSSESEDDRKSVQRSSSPEFAVHYQSVITLQAFLTKAVSTHCHRQLRHVKFTLLPDECDYYHPASSLFQEWIQVLKAWGQDMTPLTLILWTSASPAHWWPYTEVLRSHFREQVRIIEPLRQLKLLKDFFVFTDCEDPEDRDLTIPSDEIRAQKKRLEHLVMGKSYDADARGKRDYSPFVYDCE